MRSHRLTSLSLGILITVTLFLGLGLAGCRPSTQPAPAPVPSGPVALAPPVFSLPPIAQVVAVAKPSVVAIEVNLVTYDIFNQPVEQRGAGSGWIIRSDGYIVTNDHVVEGAQTVTVTLADGRVFPADGVYTDPLNDLAVVKIGAQNLAALKTGNSSQLVIGDPVVAIGNALGQGISATAGIVSQLGAHITESAGQELYDLIQTDAAINPGNSGGPLVNLAGEVIGINSLKVAQLGVEGMGYAISINVARPIIDQLISTGRIVRPWLGVGAATVDASAAATYNLSVQTGVLVTSVAPGSPAERAGLAAGDVITAINDTEIDDVDGLVTALGSHNIGDTVMVTYWRGSQSYTAQATLVESPPPA